MLGGCHPRWNETTQQLCESCKKNPQRETSYICLRCENIWRKARGWKPKKDSK